MTYKDHLWSAIIGEHNKVQGRHPKNIKRERIMKLVNYWRRAQ